MGFTTDDARQLLHNKFIVILGDSNQRAVYKDLVKFIQHEQFLSESQLRRKGEISFENDALVEGGNFGEMHNGVGYREVRQYCSDHHLVRFYFLTRVYSAYLESILSDFQAGLQPDVVIMNSCIWDITRYGQKQMEEYKTNLDLLFTRLDQVLHRECLVVWNTAMPVGYKGGEAHEKCNLRWDIVEGNFYSATLADLYKMDVLDFHYHFRVDLRHRCRDAIHWNQVAHRKFTQILLTHIACAWRVEVPDTKRIEGCNFEGVPPRMVRWNKDNACPYKNPRMNERRGCYWDANPTSAELCLLSAMSACVERPLHSVIDPCFLDDSPQIVGTMMPGYLSFDGNYCNENELPGSNHPFSGLNINIQPYQPLQPINFGSFPHHMPNPQIAFDGPQRFAMKRPLRPRSGWSHPYRPPKHPPRIY